MKDQEVKTEPLTKEEISELQWLRLLQADNTRWLSMWEFNRIAELTNKLKLSNTPNQ